MEVLHVLAEHLTKLAQNFFVPGVIFQVHLRLDLMTRANKTVLKTKTDLKKISLHSKNGRKKKNFELHFNLLDKSRDV